jgi:hypothetical protein
VPALDLTGFTTTTALNPPAGSVTYESVLIEWRDTNINNATFEGTAREILRVGLNSRIHPMGDLLFNPLAQPGEGVVPFAGAIARAVAQRPPAYRFSSALAPIFGSGETDATAIRPYDAGGQWNRSFTRPFVIIDVVSSTAEGARARMVAATAQVESAVRALQDQAGVAADVRVDVFPAVTTPPIAEVRGSRVRALGMSVLVGFGVALLFTAWRRARAT